MPEIHKTAIASSGFKVAYWNDFCAFVHDCIDFKNDKPTDYQDEILSDITTMRKVAVRGPHGLGKTALAAWVVLGFALTRDGEDWKIPTTASAWRQLTKYLWPEIHKWSRRLRWDKIGREPFNLNTELLTLSLKLSSGEAFAVASNLPELIEGAHADNLLYVFDEAKAIPDDTWDAAEGAFASGDCYALAISTPGNKQGRFYDIHARKPGFHSWHTRHVRLDEAVCNNRILPGWAEERKQQWGESSTIYRARVLGEFSDQSADSLFKLSDIEFARENETEVNFNAKKHAALDVATSEVFDSVYGQRIGNAVINIKRVTGNDTMALVGLVKKGGVSCAIDGIGEGKGVYDRLNELKSEGEIGFDPILWKNSFSARNEKDFLNRRVESFWELKQMFENRELDLTRISKEDYDKLAGQLTAIKLHPTRPMNSRGQMVLMPKEDIIKELNGNGIDDADMLAMLFGSGNAVSIKDFYPDDESELVNMMEEAF